jgi:hypothetical protein
LLPSVYVTLADVLVMLDITGLDGGSGGDALLIGADRVVGPPRPLVPVSNNRNVTV